MLMVAEKVPATSDTVPIIGIYLTIVMSLTVSFALRGIFRTIHSSSSHWGDGLLDKIVDLKNLYDEIIYLLFSWIILT